MTNGFRHHVGGGLAELLGLGSHVAGETKKQEIEGIVGSVLNDIGMAAQTFLPGAGKVIGSGLMAAGTGLLVEQLGSEGHMGLISRSQMLTQEALYGTQLVGNLVAGGLLGKSMLEHTGLKNSLSSMESDLTTTIMRKEQLSGAMTKIIENTHDVIKDPTPIFVKETFHFREFKSSDITLEAHDIQLTYRASPKSEQIVGELLDSEKTGMTQTEIEQFSRDTGLKKEDILKLWSKKPERSDIHYTSSSDGADKQSLNTRSLNTLYTHQLHLSEEQSLLKDNIRVNKVSSGVVQNRFNILSKVALGANLALGVGNYTTYAVNNNDIS